MMIYLYDALWILILVLLGFLFHKTLSVESVGRFLITYIPILISWYFGIYATNLHKEKFSFLRIVLVGLFASTVGIVIRSHILQTTITPLFVEVMSIMTVIFALFFRGILRLIR